MNFNLQQALQWGIKALKAERIEDAGTDAWYLLSYVTKLDRTDYYMKMGQMMEINLLMRYRELINMRCRHIPLQYLTKEQTFMGLPFFVNEWTLIPRQETELLVLETEQYLESEGAKADGGDCLDASGANAFKSGRLRMRVLDLCCGCGCIICALKSRHPDILAYASDISEAALAVARANVKKFGLDVTFYQSDLFENIAEHKFDIIVSNPPYIETDEIELLAEEVRCHEPRLALDGGKDGMAFYRKILKDSRQYLKRQGRLLFEIGCHQGDFVAALMEQAGFEEIEVKKDMSGHDRIVSGGMRDV